MSGTGVAYAAMLCLALPPRACYAIDGTDIGCAAMRYEVLRDAMRLPGYTDPVRPRSKTGHRFLVPSSST
eukprot:2099741-Rhodomonas_salina.1